MEGRSVRVWQIAQQRDQSLQLNKRNDQSPSGELEERIAGSLIRPSSRKGADKAREGIVEENAELAPREARGEQHKLLAEKRVKGMGYSEDNITIIAIGCSCRFIRRAKWKGRSTGSKC
jgi:hypothetical protein